MYKGEKWKRCKECGKWVKITSKTYAPKYCKNCANEMKIKMTIEARNLKK